MASFKKLFQFLSPSARRQAAKLESRLAGISKEMQSLSRSRVPIGQSLAETQRQKAILRQEKEEAERAAAQLERESFAQIRRNGQRKENIASGLRRIEQERQKLGKRNAATTPQDRAEREAKRRQEDDARRANDPLHKYIYGGEWVSNFSSSNVKRFKYNIEKQELYIQFLDGSMYGYGVGISGISPTFALGMYRAKSKGKFVWDNLRIRGTKLGAKVPYTLIAEPTDKPRVWLLSQENIEAHHAEVAADTVASGVKMEGGTGTKVKSLGGFAKQVTPRSDREVGYYPQIRQFLAKPLDTTGQDKKAQAINRLFGRRKK